MVDHLAHAPGSSVMLVIECTVGSLDAGGKVGKLIARSEQMRSRLPSVDVITVLATASERATLSHIEVEKGRAGRGCDPRSRGPSGAIDRGAGWRDQRLGGPPVQAAALSGPASRSSRAGGSGSSPREWLIRHPGTPGQPSHAPDAHRGTEK